MAMRISRAHRATCAAALLSLPLGAALLAPPALAATAAAAAGPAGPVAPFRDCPTCPELVRIPPGRFLMGSTESEGAASKIRPDRAATERPQHEVRIDQPFAIGRYEVTVAEFAEFAKESGRDFSLCQVLSKGAWRPDPKASWQSPGFDGSPRHPATCLSVEDAELYLAWLSKQTRQRYRLPTEAEWEYAARSGLAAVRVWAPGDADACRQVNAGDKGFREARGASWPTFSCDDGFPAAAPVGRFPANRYGMHDVFGNVTEFVADCFRPSHAGAPTDGSARIDAGGCPARLVKGAGWAAEPGSLRPAMRQLVPRKLRGDGFGLRVLRELTAPAPDTATTTSSR